MNSQTHSQQQPVSPERQSGILKQWNTDRHFGFIYARGEKYFLHTSKIIRGVPRVGCACTFVIGSAFNSVNRPPALEVIIGEMLAPLPASAPKKVQP